LANVTISYNVVGAAFAADVKKLVIGFSLTIYGFYYPSRFVAPEHLPVDEVHPLAPAGSFTASRSWLMARMISRPFRCFP
jgi:hypothetical protein